MSDLEEQPPDRSYYENYLNEIVYKQHKKTIPPTITLSPFEYFSNKVQLKKYKIPELKQLAKQCKLKISGNKQLLIERLHNYYENYYTSFNASIIIQRVFRGYLVRRSIVLRGNALKTRKCTNSTDFYTMEPIEEISMERFFSYEDSNGFMYGFDMFSLLYLYKTKGKLQNPYNRELIPPPIVRNLFSLYKIVNLLFPQLVQSELSQLNLPPQNERVQPRSGTSQRVNVRIQPQHTTTTNTNTNNTNRVQLYIPNYIANNNEEQRLSNAISRLQRAKQMDLEMRIREAFLEIDNLGNYTDVNWFMSLNSQGYLAFYIYYYNWWMRLDTEIQNSICALTNPFDNISDILMNEDLNQRREICISLVEAMVYTGNNIEHCRLGALHVLTILTRVSNDARTAIPWLNNLVSY